MSDIATLGIAIDTTDVTRGAAELDKLTAAGQRAQARADAMGDSIRKQNAAMVQTTSATAANAQAIDKSSAAYQKLDAEIEKIILSSNKALAAQAALGKAEAALNEGVEKGVISQQTATTTMAALAEKYAASEAAAGKATLSTSYLTREIRALGDEAASGRWRQFDGTFAGLSTRLLGIGPVALGVVGGIVAIGAAIAVVISKSEEMARAIKDVQTGFAATGNAGLLSAQQIKTYSDNLALLPGVSRDAANKTIEELSRIPYITGPLFDEVTKHAADFAALLGTDVPKATATIAKAMDDPGRAAEQLDKQLNLLTVDQRLLIQSYVEHGDRASALAVLLQALENRSRGLADNGLTPMQKGANDVARAWDALVQSFNNSGTINTAGNYIGTLLEKVAAFIGYINEHKGDIAAFANGFVQMNRLVVDPIGAVKNLASSSSAPGGGVSGMLTGPGIAEAPSATQAAAATTSATAAGQSQADRATLDATDKYKDRSDKAATLIDYENKLKDIYARQTDELKNATGEQAKQITLARQETQERIDGVQQRINQLQKMPTQTLGINVDRSEMEAGMKAIQVQQDAVKAALAEGQKYRDFYHKMGITSDADYNKATDAANNDYLAQEQRFYEQQIALVTADEAKLKSLKPANKQQADQIQTAVNEDEKKRVDLLAKEDALTKQIAADSAFRATTAPLLKAQEDFNRALKETQETTAAVSEAEQRANLEVQLGLKSQSEGIATVTAARQVAIAQLQDELTKLQAIHAQTPQYTTDGTTMTQAYIDQAKAIDQVNVKLLQMQAALDPIGQKLNQTFNSDLVGFIDKLGSGGIKTFKDLKTAALDFVGSISSSIAHQANQQLTDGILKSLGMSVNGSTGTTGGLGGFVSQYFLGTKSSSPSGAANPTSSGSTASDDPMGDFVKNLGSANTGLSSLTSGGIGGMLKSSADWIEKQILGTTTEVTATTATTSATTALAALTQAAYAAAGALAGSSTTGGGASGIGGLGGLFGGSSGGSIATADQVSQADSMAAGAASLSADGVVPFLHGGGIAGRDYAFTRSVDMRIFDNAPRLHSGGVAGLAGYETPAILKKGEEVLTEDDPRHRNNGGGRSRGGGMNVVQNFTVQPTTSRSSQAQMAAKAHAGLNSAARAM